MPGIRLKELVQEIRRQLEDIDRERISADQDAMFELQGLELELKFTIETTESGSVGFDLKLLSFGDEDSGRLEAVQTIRISYGVPSSYRGLGGRAHSSSRHRDQDSTVRPLD